MQKIFVGDVQGCGDELEELVIRAGDRFGDEFELWCVGDLVNRGPANLKALALVRELMEAGRAVAVLGNHELALLRAGFGLYEPGPLDTLDEVLESTEAHDWLDWVRCLPLVVDGEVADGEAFAMVHASAAPDRSLAELVEDGRSISARLSGDREAARLFLATSAEDDPDANHLGRFTRCRSLNPDGSWSSEPPGESRVAWHRSWSERAHDYGVVYGHWAQQGLHVAPGLRGLDTGCVHHGRGRDGFLTAWIPDDSEREGGTFGTPDERFWHIPARHAYYRERRRALGLSED